MNIKKVISGLAISICLCCSSLASLPCSAVATTGFISNSYGTRYYLDTGTYVKNDLIEINGKSYQFNKSGYMIYGLYVFGYDKYGYDRVRYFDEETGEMLTGFQTIDGQTYYFKQDTGEMLKDGYVRSSDYYYYINCDGIKSKKLTEAQHDKQLEQAVGWKTDSDGKRYYSKTTGMMVTGVRKIDKYAYYFKDNGILGKYECFFTHGRYALTNNKGQIIAGLKKSEYNNLYKKYKKSNQTQSFAKWCINKDLV